MPKPGSRAHTPSDEMARFTDRETQQATFQRHLFSSKEPQVLVFYGVGGTGKTWLLRKLREQVPTDIPVAYLNFDVADGGKRFVYDPVSALQSIKQQLAAPTPRFELALAILHNKQGHGTEAGSGVPWMDVAGDILSSFVPGGGPVFKFLSKSALVRLEGKPLEKLLRSPIGTGLVIELRKMTDQEIENNLLRYLADDLTESLPTHLNRAVTCVIFLDTFESVGAGFQNREHKRSHEKRIQDLAAQCPFALVVIAGQNRLSWDEEPEWTEYLDQHLVGGLSEDDARQFLARCDITAAELQDCILATSKESTGGYHCFSLGLCANIVVNERNGGREPEAETLRFHPQDWDKLSRRFLKSLGSDADCIWIEKLALTPKFDESAARWAYASERSTAQDAAWRNLRGYSFVERLSDTEWFSIRVEMRAALRNQPSAQERVTDDHQQWKNYWSSRSEAVADCAAGLAWYHLYCLDPIGAMKDWVELAKSARRSVPPRMREHSGILGWPEPLHLAESRPRTQIEAHTLGTWGNELSESSINIGVNLQKAIVCYEAALHLFTEQAFPKNWAIVQDNLGLVWSKLPTGSLAANLANSVACHEAALRVFTEQDFPHKWAVVQRNLGIAIEGNFIGDRPDNLRKAITCHDAALRILNEREFPKAWADVQICLGNAWAKLTPYETAAGSEPDFTKAIAFFEAALRVYTEKAFPERWAMVQNNLGHVCASLPTGDRPANIKKAIACYEASLRVFTEHEFPQRWASVQNSLGKKWTQLATNEADLGMAIAHHQAALRVFTEHDIPKGWADVQKALGNLWGSQLMGDRATNVMKAISCYQAALRVCTEKEFPDDHETVVSKLRVLADEVGTLR